MPYPQNLNKSKEQLNSFEERLKLANIELQKVQMDLMAKTSECYWAGYMGSEGVVWRAEGS